MLHHRSVVSREHTFILCLVDIFLNLQKKVFSGCFLPRLLILLTEARDVNINKTLNMVGLPWELKSAFLQGAQSRASGTAWPAMCPKH